MQWLISNAVLPQPHPEEAVVDDIAAIVLVDEFSIDQRLESKTHAAGSRQVVAADEIQGHGDRHIGSLFRVDEPVTDDSLFDI